MRLARLALAPFAPLALAAAPALQQPPSGPSASLTLPAPGATPSTANSSNAIGWPEGRTPTAPPGFAVSAYAKLDSPRSLLVLANGDVLVGQATGDHEGSPNRVTLLRGLKPDGSAAQSFTFARGFDNPFGLAVAGGYVFIADTKMVRRWPYRVGRRASPAPGRSSCGCRAPTHPPTATGRAA